MNLQLVYEFMDQQVRHRKRVGLVLSDVARDLMNRAVSHDDSKFSPDEFQTFVERSPLLKQMNVQDQEYQQNLDQMKLCLAHHYRESDHHPEHHQDGVHGMDMIQILEMLADWVAATERQAQGKPFEQLIDEAFTHLCRRFDIDGELRRVMWTTIHRMCVRQGLIGA